MNAQEAIEKIGKEVGMPDLFERIKNMGKLRTNYVDDMGVESKEVNESEENVADESEKGYIADEMQEFLGMIEQYEDDQAGMVRLMSETIAQVNDEELRGRLEEIVAAMQSMLVNPEEKEKQEYSKVEEYKQLLSEPRTPQYEGVEDVAWGDVDKTLENYVMGYIKFNPDAEQPENIEEWSMVDNLPQPVRSWISAKSFLGNPESETFDDLVFFPVVNPNTNNLNRGALIAVVGGRGQAADIPQDLYQQTEEVAYSLLEEEFDFMREDEEKMEIEEIAKALKLDELGSLLKTHEKSLTQNEEQILGMQESLKSIEESFKAVDALVGAFEELVNKQKNLFGKVDELEKGYNQLQESDEQKIAEKEARFTPFWASRYQASKAAETVLSDNEAKEYNKPQVPNIIQQMSSRHGGGGK